MISRNPKRLWIAIPTLRGGGAERVVATLVRHFDPTNFSVTLIVVDMRGAVHAHSIPDGVRLVDLDCRHVRTALPKLIKLIRREKPDVVLSTLSHLNLALAACKWAFPRETLLVARETVVPSPLAASSLSQRLLFSLYRLVHSGFDRIICQSNDMRVDIVENFGVPEEKCVVIPNPIDTAEITKQSQLPARLPETPPGTIKLVAAGRLTYQKGFDILLEAVARLERANIYLFIMGDGPQREALTLQAEALGISNRVVFLGYVANPYPVMAIADAFVLSSRFEGMPNVVLEALGCGTPVIAMPAPGGVQEILGGLERCEIAAGMNAEALALAIEKWLAGPRLRIPSDTVATYAVATVTRQYEAALLGIAIR